MCGLRDDHFRRNYMRRADCDVLAMLETNCSSDEEASDWAKGWEGQTFWASQPRDPSSSSLGSHRGVALLLRASSAFGTGKVIACDTTGGRFLAVLVPIYERPTLILVVHSDAGPSQASFLHSVRDAVSIPAGTLDIHLMIDANTTPTSLDYIRLSPLPPRTHHPSRRFTHPGHTALASLLAHLHNPRDAFRALYPRELSFTYSHMAGGDIVSKSRLDRHYLSPHLLSGSAPRLLSVTHLAPSSHALRHIRGVTSHLSSCGDHAAVDTILAYSDIPRPPRVWRLPLHTLADPPTVQAIRDETASSLARHAHLSPLDRVPAWLRDIRALITTRERQSSASHRANKQRLYKELARLECALGLGVGPQCGLSSVLDPNSRAARRALLETERQGIERQLDAVKTAEDRRWLLDRAYDADISDETCNRAFFSRQREVTKLDSHISKISVPPGPHAPPNTLPTHYYKQHQFNKAADRFYGSVAGGLFNLQHESDDDATSALHDALRADGKVLPPTHATLLSSPTSLICRLTVKRAIAGLSLGAVSPDFPAEFFKLFVIKPPPTQPDDASDPDEDDDSPNAEAQRAGNQVLDLLVSYYHASLAAGTITPSYNVSHTTLIHKKGSRHYIANYRPISVCSLIYKILSRCLADALQTVLPWVVDVTQVACQAGKSCFSASRYIQDLIHHCDDLDMSGLLVFCDATKAFDRVNHAYLLSTLRAMHIPEAFISFYTLLLSNAITRLKVNGYLGSPILLRNGLRQGCPIAPLCYLITVQPFLSMLRLSLRPHGVRAPLPHDAFHTCHLNGIPIPTSDGNGSTCAVTAAMADDIAVALRDGLDLLPFKCMMHVYERASGSLNNWQKSYGLLLGSLTRQPLTLPPNWDPNHIDFTCDPIRYLGIFLGSPEKVALKWIHMARASLHDHSGSDLTSRMLNRFDQWASIGVGSTYAARNLIIKNSVLSMAWYMIESQTLPSQDSILTFWQEQAWRFVEATATALRDNTHAHTTSRVARLLLTQDYAEGGRRCLDIELFSRALLLRSVRGLYEPGPHPYHNLPFHWIRLSYAPLRQDPRSLLLSNCTFTHLHPSTPPFWCTVLQAWGSLPGGLHPTVPSPTFATPDPRRPPPPSSAPLFPQPTYQLTRPLPPYSDGLWHRSPTRRDPPPDLSYSLGGALSLPLGHCPFLAGFLGAPLRDSHPTFLSSATRGRATRVTISPPLSSASRSSAYALHTWLETLARHDITHVIHLLTGLLPGEQLRLRTVAELSTPHPHSRRDRLPRWLCEELLAAIPPPIQQVIDAAASRRLHDPSLTLRDLCHLSPLPDPSFVTIPNTSLIFEIPSSQPDPLTFTLGGCFHIRPEGRLITARPSPLLPTSTPRCLATEMHVWFTSKLPHSQECREFEERNPESVTRVGFVGGACVDSSLLFHEPGPPSYPSPATLSLFHYPCDRAHDPIPLSTLDVYSLYHHALTYRRTLPRTLDPDHPPSTSSTSFTHLFTPPPILSLEAPPSLKAIRLSICRASHPNPTHGRREAHALYLTVNDARPIGNGRCLKPTTLGRCPTTGDPISNPTYMHCDICWRVDGVLRRETTAHVIRDCPYSHLILDPLLRAIHRALSPTHPLLTSPSADLLTTCELLTSTGSTLYTPKIHLDIGPNIAGSISLALFARAARNAASLTSTQPSSPNFSPEPVYAAIVSNLQARASHTFKLASALDGRLTILHPGIEEWLAEHGHVVEWQQRWKALLAPTPRPDGLLLSLPSTLSHATIGPSGALGPDLIPIHVLTTLTTLRPPGRHSSPHVHVRFSIGRKVGAGFGPSFHPADPSLDSWPMSPDTQPEYAIRRILDERTTRTGLLYLVDWRDRPNAATWEPASNLADTTALARWLARAGPSSFTFTIRGDIARLDALLALPNLPPARASNLRNLRFAMDSHGVIRFERRYPIMAGGISGGRATYYDTRGKGNTFLTCLDAIRSYVFGAHYDEIDISRSHISSVFGTWISTVRPRPPTLNRFLHDQATLEADITYELTAARPALLADLNALILTAQGVPNRSQSKAITQASKALEKSYMPPKQVFSAVINARSVEAWYRPFGACPVITQLVRDVRLMITAIPNHPLCAPLARALRAAGRDSIYVISTCLAHLDDAALTAAAAALTTLDVPTSLTINDSLCISNDHSHSTHTILTTASQAAAARVGYAVDFKLLPHLRKPTEPPPTLTTIAHLLEISPPSHPTSPAHVPTPSPRTTPPPAPSPLAPSPDLISPYLASRLPLPSSPAAPAPPPLRRLVTLSFNIHLRPRPFVDSPSPTPSDDGAGVFSSTARARGAAPPPRPPPFHFPHLFPPTQHPSHPTPHPPPRPTTPSHTPSPCHPPSPQPTPHAAPPNLPRGPTPTPTPLPSLAPSPHPPAPRRSSPSCPSCPLRFSHYTRQGDVWVECFVPLPTLPYPLARRIPPPARPLPPVPPGAGGGGLAPAPREPVSPIHGAPAPPLPHRSPDRISPPSQGPSPGLAPPPTLPFRPTSLIRGVLGLLRSAGRILTWRERLDKG